MNKEEIALRLVEAWARETGIAEFYRFLTNYEHAIEFIEELSKED